MPLAYSMRPRLDAFGLTGALEADTSYSCRFDVSADCFLRSLSWYRASGVAGQNTPTALRLYRVGDETLIYECDPVPDGNGAGWKTHEVETPVQLSAAQVYAVVGCWADGDHAPNALQSSMDALDPFFDELTNFVYYLAGSCAFPTNLESTYVYGLDAGVSVVGPESQYNTVNSQTMASLRAYLSSNPLYNERQDALPWITHAALTDETNGLAGIRAQVDANGAAIAAYVDDWLDFSAQVSADLASVLLRIGPLETYGTITPQGVSAGVEIVRQRVEDVASIVETIADTSFATLREWFTLSPDLSDTARWTLVGTTTGSANGVVTDQADIYRLTFTAIPPLMPQHTLPGDVLWLPRAGWCAPIRDGYVGPRKFLDFAANDIRYDGQLMHGLVVYLPPGLEWSCDAYVLDRP